MTAELVRSTAPAASATATILGTVSDPGGYPLAGVTIVLHQAAGGGVRLGTTTTDDVGGYRFTRVPAVPGEAFRVEAMDESGAHVSTSTTFTLDAGSATQHHTTMQVAGYLQGTVTTGPGTAASEPPMRVCVTAAGQSTFQRVYVSARGTFRIGGLPAGNYAVVFHDETPRDDEVGAHWTTVSIAAGRTMTLEDQELPG